MNKETNLESEVKFKLPQKKVTVRLVKRARGPVKDPNHIMYNLLPGATYTLCVPNKKGTDVIGCPLNNEEIAFFENKRLSGMSFEVGDLSPYKEEKNFWRSKKSRVVLDDKPMILDLSKPMDYLQYKILLSNKDFVAPNLASEFSKATYTYVMEHDEDVKVSTISRGNKQKRAWKIAGKIEDNAEKMIDYLTLLGKRPSANAKIDFLRAEITKQIENNIDGFLEIAEDPQYETRLLLTKALQKKAIIREGYKYFLPGGDPLCKKGEVNNMKNALNFLDADENQDIRLSLETRIEKK